MIELKQPRPPRHSIRADAQIADSVSGRLIIAKTSDVSLGAAMWNALTGLWCAPTEGRVWG